MTIINDKGKLGTKCKIIHGFNKVDKYCWASILSIVDKYCWTEGVIAFLEVNKLKGKMEKEFLVL
uniref:Putative ovule protein n=1 Tax=Solanum chacoense TaxID=4108 RepID=A0A0V0GYV5_SOLCH